MNISADKPTPERESTDESLQAERDKTDAALIARGKILQTEAASVLGRARRLADHVVQAAREKADAKSDATPQEQRALDATRISEDRVLLDERVGSDEDARVQRPERRRALEHLLRLEREGTDEDLLQERERADEPVTTRELMLAMVSHDLRNMLGIVALNAEALMRESDETAEKPQARQRVQRIQRSVARMNRLVGDLLDVASLEEGKLPVQATPHDVLALVEEALEMYSGAAAAHSVRLETPARVGVVMAQLDHDRILQVLGNLLGNAIKFTPAGGCVRVEATHVLTEVRVTVTDTGPGVLLDHLESIFGRFFQVGNAQRSGLGLGLYISRCIVESHRGHIWAESTPGGGTTLVFTLPAA